MWHSRFAGTYVINLPARTDRRAQVASELAKLGIGFRFLDAVPGKSNPYAIWFFRNVLRQSADVSPGAIGCHISHALVWIQTLLDARISHDEFVLVIEDDLVWAPATTNDLIDSLLSRVPADANMIKFSVADWSPNRESLERRRQVKRIAEGVYMQTSILGGTLMYAVRKSALPTLVGFDYPGNFDNALLPSTYILIPDSEGVRNESSSNYHFGVCFQGDHTSDVQT